MSDRFATFDDAVRWLTDSTDYERMRRVRYNADTFSLDRMRRLADAVGRPERRLRHIVHIAGTKGKGSTAAMVEAVLRGHGMRTGLFTSPHLVDMRERIQIDRRWIDRDLMRRTVGRVAEAVEAALSGDPPTYFEMMTAVGLAAFADERVDAAVLEVGLGGRLDSTNIVDPTVTVITPISLDHVHQLGGTVEAIAREKAGIVKPGVPLVVAPQAAEAMAVISQAAAERGAPMRRVGREVTFRWEASRLGGRPGGRVTIATPAREYANIDLPLAGRVQGVNAACAVAAAEAVLGDAIRVEATREALAGVEWAGRMQAFPGPVTVILDGAHNADSLSRLLAAVAEYYPGERRVVVFGSAADKDIDGMMGVLAESGLPVVFTRTDNPRAADPGELAAALRSRRAALTGDAAAPGGALIDASADPVEALARARLALGGLGVAVICGSLYLVGMVLERPGAFGLGG